MALWSWVGIPGGGFEPPLEDPKSSVLPLDDPGLYKKANRGGQSDQRNRRSPLDGGVRAEDLQIRLGCAKFLGSSLRGIGKVEDAEHRRAAARQLRDPRAV